MGYKEPQYFDIDQRAAFDYCQTQLEAADVPNFVVEFDDDNARCAASVSPQQVAGILQRRKDAEHQNECLWLNLWGWSAEHHEIVKLIAREYDVSLRLAHMIGPKPTVTAEPTVTPSKEFPRDQSKSHDPERAQPKATVAELQPKATAGQRKYLRGIGDVVNDLWHFYSVGFGNRYVSLSWNGLFFLPDTPSTKDSSKPTAIRIWSSLLLCDDGTILSVFECPPSCPPEVVKRIRFNQRNVFRHLTKSSTPHILENPLMQISVRSQNERVKSSKTELASLMMYYLFDDWVNTYAQVAGGKDSYRHRLDQIREHMIVTADVDQVKTLHSLGRQLIVLKLVYRSYQAIIQRVIQRLRAPASHNKAERSLSLEGLRRTTTSNSMHHDVAASLSNSVVDLDETNVRLSPSVIARFERLLDRIEICALTEVEECLKEKEAMMLMNFNLIQISESRAVEDLTRTTILLAKVTILFLPLSLVSGYFSLQFAAIDELYSLKTFWLTFLVVTIVTLTFLVGSSRLGFPRIRKGSYREMLKAYLSKRRNTEEG